MKIAAWWNEKSFLQKFFVLFLIASGILWTIVPATYHSTLPYDPPETLMWGSTFNLGNAKHPPMSGYMLFYFCKLFGFANFSIFLLSQICVTVGFVYIYKLSRCFFDKDESVLSTLLITFYIFYNLETPKFNANIPHLLFMPMMCYYFYRGCFANKWHHWMLLALSTACAFLSKYSAGVLGPAFCLYLLLNKDARKVLLTVKPYAAGLVFTCLILPHILYLAENDFLVFEYINHGGDVKYSYWGQLVVQFFAILLPLACMSMACFLIHWIGKGKFPKLKISVTCPAALQYSACIIGVQALFLMFMGILGHRLLTIWTFPLYLTAGIFIMSFYPRPAAERMKRCFVIVCSVFPAGLIISSLVYRHCRSSYRYHVGKAELRAVTETFYRENTGREVPFITGAIWESSMLLNSYGYSVKAAPAFDKLLLALHLDTIAAKGALVISCHPEETEKELQRMFDVDLKWQEKELTYKALLGKKRTFRFHLAMMPPARPVKTEKNRRNAD